MSHAVAPSPEVNTELLAEDGPSLRLYPLYFLTSIASRSFLGIIASGNLAVVEVVVVVVPVVIVVVVVGLVGAVVGVVVVAVVLHPLQLRPRPSVEEHV